MYIRTNLFHCSCYNLNFFMCKSHNVYVHINMPKLNGLIFLAVQTSQAVEDIKSVFIRSGSLIGGVIGGIIGGVVIGVVMTVIIYKIIFGVPNRDTFNKRKDLEKRTNKK